MTLDDRADVVATMFIHAEHGTFREIQEFTS